MHRLCRGRERALSKSRPNSRIFSCVLIADANEMIQMSYPLSISSWTRASEAAGINASRPLGPWRSWAIARCQSRPSSGRSTAPGESAWRRRLSTGTASPSSEGKTDFGFGANFTLAGVSCTVRDVKEPFAAAATFFGGGLDPEAGADFTAAGTPTAGVVKELEDVPFAEGLATPDVSLGADTEEGFEDALFCFGDFAFLAETFGSAGANDSATAADSAVSKASAKVAASWASTLALSGAAEGFEIFLLIGLLDLLLAVPALAGGALGGVKGTASPGTPSAATGVQTQASCQEPSPPSPGRAGGAIGLAGTLTVDVVTTVLGAGTDLTSDVFLNGGGGSGAGWSLAAAAFSLATAPALAADLERSSRRCCWRLSDSKFSGSKKSKCETRPRSCLCLWDLRLGSPPRFPRNFAFGGPLAIPRKARSKGKGCVADVKTSDAIQCLVPKAQ